MGTSHGGGAGDAPKAQRRHRKCGGAGDAPIGRNGGIEKRAGLKSQRTAKSMWKHKDGRLRVTDDPYLETKEYIGGFWVLDCADMDWGQKASAACGVPVEVRGFW